MPLSQEVVDSLRQNIKVAFNGILYPGDDQLLSPDCYDEHELVDFYGKLGRASWEQIPFELIDYHHDILPFLSPIAYQFFLPAYLVRGLDTYLKQNNVFQFAVFNLIPPLDSDNSQWKHFILQKSALGIAQNKAVLQFLRAIRDYDETLTLEADDAIRRYWAQFNAERITQSKESENP